MKSEDVNNSVVLMIDFDLFFCVGITHDLSGERWDIGWLTISWRCDVIFNCVFNVVQN